MAFNLNALEISERLLGYYRRFSYFTVLTCTVKQSVVILSSKRQKHTTGSANTLTHTYTHTHTHAATATTTNKTEQLGTASHRLLMVTDSDAPYVCEIPTASSKKKREFWWLAVGTPAGFDPKKACFKHSRWFGKRHKTDTFTKLRDPTVRAACSPQTVLDRHF